MKVIHNTPPQEVKGSNLRTLKSGTIVKLIRYEGSMTCITKMGLILMVTDNADYSLLELETGHLWKNGLPVDDYVFEKLDIATMLLT